MTDSPKRRYFPSIPSPVHKLKKSAKYLEYNRSIYNKSSNYVPSHKSMNYDDMKSDEKIVSHFLLKYLERKQTYQSKYNEYSRKSYSPREDLKMNPNFRRTYLKNLKKQKKLTQNRFILGSIDGLV